GVSCFRQLQMVFSSHDSESTRILDPRFALPLLIAGALFLIVAFVFLVGLVQFLLTWGSLLKNVDLRGVILFIAPVAVVTALGLVLLALGIRLNRGRS